MLYITEICLRKVSLYSIQVVMTFSGFVVCDNRGAFRSHDFSGSLARCARGEFLDMSAVHFFASRALTNAWLSLPAEVCDDATMFHVDGNDAVVVSLSFISSEKEN